MGKIYVGDKFVNGKDLNKIFLHKYHHLLFMIGIHSEVN